MQAEEAFELLNLSKGWLVLTDFEKKWLAELTRN